MRRTWRWGAAATVAVFLPVLFGTTALGAPPDSPDVAEAVRLQAAVRDATGLAGAARVSADDDEAVAIAGGPVAAVGEDHTCAITVLGDVWCWGAGDAGQLGDGSRAGSAEPVMITGSGPLAGSTVNLLTAGRAHTCALVAARGAEDSQDLWCWGDNADGQLGDGSTTSRDRPVRVAREVVDVAAGARHTCAVDEDAAVSCWGRNDDGQLGTGSAGAPGRTPQPVTGLPDVRAVAAGDDSTCALDEDGAAWCWGSDADGQLGDGGGASATPSATPVRVVTADVDEEFVALDGGRGHMCAVDGDGAAWCWGADSAGQLGDGAPAAATSQPVRVAGTASYVSIDAGGDSTCAVAGTAAVWCWGANGSGQLGVGDRADRAAPARVDQNAVRTSPLFEYVYGSAAKLLIGVAVGGQRTCAVDVAPNHYCWGDNAGGRLGTGTSGDALVATPTSLIPDASTGVRLQPGDKRLGARWRTPADTGAAPPEEYAAIALTGTGIDAIVNSQGCGTLRPGCTIEKLTNGVRYEVFVGMATRGGVSWTAATAGTPVAPAAPGGGGGLPITGPPTVPLAAAGLALVVAGALCLLGDRRRRHC